jgi:hypothetical protein
VELNLEINDGTIKFSARWLLHQLILHLSHHLSFKCMHKRFGTVLYKTNGDILTSLSWALGENNTLKQSYVYVPEKQPKNQSQNLTDSAMLVNTILHTEISRLSSSLVSNDPSNFSITKFVDEADSRLTNFLNIATQTVREQRYIEYHRWQNDHIKKTRIFSLFCVLMYTTNPQQLTPMHNLLADIVETCGGSRQLIKILNRLGFSSSPDSHDRFVTSHAEEQRDSVVWNELSPSSFTIASVDNFDMLQSHSAVHSGSHHRSYHGTTVQFVQPFLPLITTNSSMVASSNSITSSSTTTSSNFTNSTTAPLHSILPLSNSVVAAEGEPTFTNTSNEIVTHDNRRRRSNNSPASSPHKLGKDGPKRRRTVTLNQLTHATVQPKPSSISPYHHLKLEYFELSEQENSCLEEIQSNLLSYMMLKMANNEENVFLSDMRYFIPSNPASVNTPTNIHYLELINENADSEETMLNVIESLLNTFKRAKQEYVMLVGDGKTYQYLCNIKRRYGESLNTLLIFPGDWHTLKNYQCTLMKAYYGAGLEEIAKASGYRGSTLISLSRCTNFKRTHRFLLQVWEALFRVILRGYLEKSQKYDILEEVGHILNESIHDEVLPFSLTLLVSSLTADLKDKILQFINDQGDRTWTFWGDFVFKNCLAYVTLFISIRGSNWNLRIASLKCMLPLFAAFDRDYYQRIIPNHLADTMIYPPDVQQFLSSGGFTVYITGEQWKAVALDEAHEMCINKDLKSAITYPTEQYLQKTTLFFNYRIKLTKNFLAQLFPETTSNTSPNVATIIDKTKESSSREVDILSMIDAITKCSLLPAFLQEDRGLVNTFNGLIASPEQAHDLLNFRSIGQNAINCYVQQQILGKTTISSKIRRKKLLTMSIPLKTSRKSTKEKESEKVIKCLQRKLAWSRHYGHGLNNDLQQYSIYPRALCDENGLPHKAPKKHWTDKLMSRYKQASMPPFINELPADWIPQSAVIDTMFLINTKPLRTTNTVTDYAHLLFNRFIKQYFLTGVQQVHLIFDKSKGDYFNPKAFEQQRRDKSPSTTHEHISFNSLTILPHQLWSSILECRQCKASVVKAVGSSFFKNSRFWLEGQQTLVLAGCFDDDTVWVVEAPGITNAVPQPEPMFRSNAREGDQLIWRHAVKCSASKVLIYSPDTDIYNIGLTIQNQHKEIIIQNNVLHSPTKKYVHLNNLTTALVNDPDLANVTQSDICSIFVALFVGTGSDFTSYIKEIGKATFLNAFFQHADFITGISMPGSLNQFREHNKNMGFLSFLRLIGTVYFKKHFASFFSLYQHKTPQQLYNSTDNTLPIEERHNKWIQQIRDVVGERIVSEDQRVPSTTSLWRHWLRTTYVCMLWCNSPQPDVFCGLPSPENSGWLKKEGNFFIDWEDPAQQSQNIWNSNLMMKVIVVKVVQAKTLLMNS